MKNDTSDHFCISLYLEDNFRKEKTLTNTLYEKASPEAE